MSSDTERRYCLHELEERIREEIKEYLEQGVDLDDYSHEIADNLTPIYFTDCFQLCDDYPEIGNEPIDSGLLEGNDMYPAKVCQIAVYEWILHKLHEILEEVAQ